jgi:hypothetical protein
VLSEELVSVLPTLVANTRGRSIGPTKTQILQMCTRARLPAPDDAGKEMLVRMVLSNAVDEDPRGGEKFVTLFVTAARAVGCFRPEDDNYAGADAIRRLRAAFDREGWILETDGQLRPKVLDSLEGRELTVALQNLVRRARRGADDAELVIGTSKNLEEAVARHVLTQVTGGYSPTMDFVSTLYMAFDRLGLATPTTTQKLDEDPYRELVLAIYFVGRAVNRLRNDRGDGHGRPKPPVATALEAQLTSLGAALVSELLLTALEPG